MKTAIVNLGAIVSGDWREPYAKGDSIVMAQGRIISVGPSPTDAKDCDVVIDADGATAIPGFI
jgi:enamidase